MCETERRATHSRRRERVAPAPISARLLLQGADTEERAGAGVFPPGMEDPFPLKGVMVRLFDLGAPTTDVAWSHADNRGHVSFTTEQVGGRAVERLGLEVFARRRGWVGACYEGADRRWSFTVAAGDVRPGVAADVVALLGSGMTIQVPDATRTQHLWSTAVETTRYGGLAGEEQHPLRMAFVAYAVVVQMRSWLWNTHHDADAYPFPGEVSLVYPATSCRWTPEQRIYLTGGSATYSRTVFNFSALCHEFGHHFFNPIAPNCADPGGTHYWEELDERLSDVDFRRGLAMDFSEGFATFVGQQFLRSARYETDSSYHDIEAGSTCAQGDLATSALLWDLADAGGREAESAQVPLLTLLRSLRTFAAPKHGQYLTLPDYVTHLVDTGVITRDVATNLYAQNHLTAVAERWDRLRRTRASFCDEGGH